MPEHEETSVIEVVGEIAEAVALEAIAHGLELGPAGLVAEAVLGGPDTRAMDVHPPGPTDGHGGIPDGPDQNMTPEPDDGEATDGDPEPESCVDSDAASAAGIASGPDQNYEALD